jgi:hypothetical protein
VRSITTKRYSLRLITPCLDSQWDDDAGKRRSKTRAPGDNAAPLTCCDPAAEGQPQRSRLSLLQPPKAARA